MVVVDMPFGTYEAGAEQAFTNATRVLKETGAQAVKVEAGPTSPRPSPTWCSAAFRSWAMSACGPRP